MRDQKMGPGSRFYFSASIIEFGKRLLVTNSVCDSKFVWCISTTLTWRCVCCNLHCEKYPSSSFLFHLCLTHFYYFDLALRLLQHTLWKVSVIQFLEESIWFLLFKQRKNTRFTGEGNTELLILYASIKQEYKKKPSDFPSFGLIQVQNWIHCSLLFSTSLRAKFLWW